MEKFDLVELKDLVIDILQASDNVNVLASGASSTSAVISLEIDGKQCALTLGLVDTKRQ